MRPSPGVSVGGNCTDCAMMWVAWHARHFWLGMEQEKMEMDGDGEWENWKAVLSILIL